MASFVPKMSSRFSSTGSKLKVSKSARYGISRGEDVRDGLLNPMKPYHLNEVEQKLRDHPEYINEDDEIIADLAERLVTPHSLSDYFSHLVEETGASAVSNIEKDVESSVELSIEREMVQDRVETAFSQALKFPVKLVLTEIEPDHTQHSSTLSRLQHNVYGPLRAAIVIGDVVLEWTTSSLVVPATKELAIPVLRSEMNPQTQYGRYAQGIHTDLADAITELNFARQIEHMYDITAKKQEAIDRVIEVIVRYNRLFYYHPIRRNGQHFVTDVMKALGIEDPPQFSGVLGRYLNELKQGKAVHKHGTHKALDKYVQKLQTSSDINKLSQHDLEYLLCQYFQFHITSRAEARDPNDWSCEYGRDCKMRELESRIDEQALLLHQYNTS